MDINYYNSVKLCSEIIPPKKLSFTQKMDKWGTELVAPYQTKYNGRSYYVEDRRSDLDTVEENQFPPPQSTTFGFKDKCKVKFGILLKRIAACFNSKIKAKYAVCSTQDPAIQKQHLEALRPKVKRHDKSDGDPITFLLVGIWCMLCCMACGCFNSNRH